MTLFPRWTALPVAGLLLLALAACDSAPGNSTAPTAVLAGPTAAGSSEAAPTAMPADNTGPTTASSDTLPTAGCRRAQEANHRSCRR